jgi:WD40 repeat protein
METTFVKTKEFFGHSGQIFSIAFDGEFIYSASADKFVTRWNVDTAEQDKFAIRFEKSPYSILLISNNQKLIVGLDNGDLHIFDLVDRKEVKFYQQHKSAVFYLLENKSKNQFYSCDADGNLAIWNSVSLKLELILPFNCSKIRRMALNFDESKLFIACQDGYIRILETEYYNLIDEIYAHEGGVSAVCIDPNDNTVLFTGGKDAHLKVWNLRSKECVKSIPAHNYVIYDILILNEKSFVTISRDKSIKIWDRTSLKVIQKIDSKSKGHKHSVNSIVKLNDNAFATSSDDKTIKFFQLIDSKITFN